MPPSSTMPSSHASMRSTAETTARIHTTVQREATEWLTSTPRRARHK